jgi:NaMN:DMB phosphoribosyltransferase
MWGHAMRLGEKRALISSTSKNSITRSIQQSLLTKLLNHKTNMPSPAHLISKVGDPIFAAFIGLSAATMRINREEKELGRSTQETINAGFR